MRVLLVDNDDSLRRALARTIRLARFEVEAFKSVEALLARGVREDDACLVLDVDLDLDREVHVAVASDS